VGPGEPALRDELGAELEAISAPLERVEQIILEASAGRTPALTDYATHLARAGGKRIRPAVVILASMMGSGVSEQVLQTAAAIEMTHLATLYHDDVIDEADLRRGVPSANELWGNTVAILAGDYLFARASAIAAEVGGRVPHVLADAIAEVVHGQVRELERSRDPRRPVDQYFNTIREKTAALIEASARLGAILGGASSGLEEATAEFGAEFGLAFQIADDLLDLSGDREMLGKPPGTDLKDGVYTLPVILAVDKDPSVAELLEGDPDLDSVREVVASTGAFDEALAFAREHARGAVEALGRAPDGPAVHSLSRIAGMVIDRVPPISPRTPVDARAEKPADALIAEQAASLRDSRIPSHLAIIPDGNRRWAEAHGRPAVDGHRAGFEIAKRLARFCRRIGIHTVSIWAFSTENWRRGPEVGALMSLFEEWLKDLLPEAIEEEVRVIHLGRKFGVPETSRADAEAAGFPNGLPDSLVAGLEEIEEKTAGFERNVINLAINYGGADEVRRAVTRLLEHSRRTESAPETLDVENFLDTAGQPHPNPDLVWRTSGERRYSGLMPIQAAYAEFAFTSHHFPDLAEADVVEAVKEYSRRIRRFGG
jgi:heptaprenyl diphosphate synthase